MKKLAILVLCIRLLYGCSFLSSTQKAPPPTLKAASFDYAPSQTTTSAQPIKIAIINPSFAKSFAEGNQEPFVSFSKSMSSDFVEIVSARGFQYLGPLGSYDEMVYNDKKSTDLVLETEIDVTVTPMPLKYRTVTNYATGAKTYHYYADGTATITGKVNLSLSEPFTKTKVWVKSLPITPTSFTAKTLEYYTKDIPLTDPYLYNALVTALQSIYTSSMQLAWNHLEPEELSAKKQEATEIKKNSGFIKN